ncbi:hypothetical protein BDQ94DRAFT_171167 [Aspergillus welwitschiae]|uniref:Uncharacterized protein n=1 Tax=Aspergillus welwitschiae TaxID=1341132 RepID=A0A3F3PZK6_9EURO|nr:hypothetical protein BDQ94DRAFT_171167 [Aspergillus welwitschiae]RDH32403.1 hypothetical protein BDQ94DRAFT_171167 [Aspergillus welwitschiae]
MAQQGQPQQVAPAAPAPQLPHVPRVGKAFNVLVIRDYLRKVQASAPNVPQDDSSYAGDTTTLAKLPFAAATVEDASISGKF